MMKNSIKINSNAIIKTETEILSKNEFHALPVIDNEILVEIVNTTYLLAYLLNQSDSENTH